MFVRGLGVHGRSSGNCGACVHPWRRSGVSRDERPLRARQKPFNAGKLLIADEPGYVPFTAVGSKLLFEVFT